MVCLSLEELGHHKRESKLNASYCLWLLVGLLWEERNKHILNKKATAPEFLSILS